MLEIRLIPLESLFPAGSGVQKLPDGSIQVDIFHGFSIGKVYKKPPKGQQIADCLNEIERLRRAGAHPRRVWKEIKWLSKVIA